MQARHPPAAEASRVLSLDEAYLGALGGAGGPLLADLSAEHLEPPRYLARRRELLERLAGEALEADARAPEGAARTPTRFTEAGDAGGCRYRAWRQLLLQAAFDFRRREAEDQAIRVQAAAAMHRALQAEKEERERFAAGAADVGPRVASYGLRLQRVVHLGEPVRCIAAHSPSLVALCLESGDVAICDTDEVATRLVGHAHAVTAADWAPDGAFLLTTSLDKTARLWQADDWQCLRIVYGEQPLLSGRFSPANTNLVVLAGERQLRMLNVSTGKLDPVVKKLPAPFSALEFGAGGEHVLVAADALLQFPFPLSAGGGGAPSALIPAGQGVARLCHREYVTTTHGPAAVFTARGARVHSLALGAGHGAGHDVVDTGVEAVALAACAQSDFVVAGGPDRTVSVFPAHAPGELVSRTQPSHAAAITAVAWASPAADSILLTADAAGDVIVWGRVDAADDGDGGADASPDVVEAPAEGGGEVCPICGAGVAASEMLSHVEGHVSSSSSPPADVVEAPAAAAAEEPAPTSGKSRFRLRRGSADGGGSGRGKRFGFRRKKK